MVWCRVIPPVGSRILIAHKGSHRVYELTETLPAGTPSTENRHGCDRHTLHCVEESGYIAGHQAIGTDMHVEDAWFQYNGKIIK